MDHLFGLSMTVIMAVLLVMFGVCLAVVAAVWLTNRVMFRLGLRNAWRRRAQMALTVTGLMLATLIITASFSTGDSIDYSITKSAYDNLHRTDLSLHHFNMAGAPADSGEGVPRSYAPVSLVTALAQALAADPDIEGYIPFHFEGVPVTNPRTRLAEPEVILTGIDAPALDRFHGLTLTSGARAVLTDLGPDRAYVNARLAKRLDVTTGDTLTVVVRGTEHRVTVAGVVRNERASGTTTFGMGGEPGLVLPMSVTQQWFGLPGRTNNVSIVLRGGERGSLSRSQPAAARLRTFLADEANRRSLGAGDFAVTVEENKRDGVEDGEVVGNRFTTIFVLLGLLSILAGMALIFTIFVMLAAERRTEMGITRAVGARRSALVGMFLAEGMVYDLLAGAVGAALGVAAAVWLIIGGGKLVMGESFEFLAAHITVRSLVVSYCLGVVLTFLTITFSSLRIARFEIVPAIRGSDDIRPREGRRRRQPRWILLGMLALIVPPLGWYLLLRRGLGLPRAWVAGSGLLLLAAILLPVGLQTNGYFPVGLGVTVAILGAAVLARSWGMSARAVWSAAGMALALFWLTPMDWHERLAGDLDGGTEMWMFSSLMVVVALTLLIVFNGRWLVRLATPQERRPYRLALVLLGAAVLVGGSALLLGGGGGLADLLYLPALVLALGALVAAGAVRFAWFAPALKMGVAYSLAGRFRTGMTIAMVALIVFALVEMSVINASFMAQIDTDAARGGWDVAVSTTSANPITDLAEALRNSGTPEGERVAEQIRGAGRLTPGQWEGSQQVRQPGDADWQLYPVRAADAAFFTGTEMRLEGRASGYESDRAVYEAVSRDARLALLDALPVKPPDDLGFGMQPSTWRLAGVTIENGRFAPFDLELRDPVTGREVRVTVVGVLSTRIPAGLLYGVLTNSSAYTAVFGPQEYRDFLVHLAPGADSGRAAKDIRAALVTRGVEAHSLQELLDGLTAQSRGVMRIMQAFMALGLFVGIAALGVVAVRSVMERRQQIGMLRAIGYQRATITLTFLLESGFIALMGILAGLLGAVILAWNLISTNYIEGSGDVPFIVPWMELVVVSVATFAASLLMTWWPSRNAARLPIAETLRYE